MHSEQRRQQNVLLTPIDLIVGGGSDVNIVKAFRAWRRLFEQSSRVDIDYIAHTIKKNDGSYKIGLTSPEKKANILATYKNEFVKHFNERTVKLIDNVTDELVKQGYTIGIGGLKSDKVEKLWDFTEGNIPKVVVKKEAMRNEEKRVKMEARVKEEEKISYSSRTAGKKRKRMESEEENENEDEDDEEIEEDKIERKKSKKTASNLGGEGNGKISKNNCFTFIAPTSYQGYSPPMMPVGTIVPFPVLLLQQYVDVVQSRFLVPRAAQEVPIDWKKVYEEHLLLEKRLIDAGFWNPTTRK